MEKINYEDLQEIIRLHGLWLDGKKEGVRANMSFHDLRDSDLRDSNLRGSNLRGSDLRDSDLRGSDLRDSNLRGSDLRDSNLRGSDLRGSDLDFSCLPLWCGGLNFKMDKKQLCQLKYHLKNLCNYSGFDLEDIDHNESHLITEHGLPKL